MLVYQSDTMHMERAPVLNKYLINFSFLIVQVSTESIVLTLYIYTWHIQNSKYYTEGSKLEKMTMLLNTI